jgi:hypothetical protein
VHLRTTIEPTGGTTAGIRLDDAALAALDAGKRPRVAVTIDGFAFRTTVGSHDGSPFIPVSNAVRADAGVAAGDEVDVTIVVDTAPRTVEVPDDLRAALDAAEDEVRSFFDALTDSQRKAYVTWVTGAKQQATRDRRVGQAVERLRAGRKQP